MKTTNNPLLHLRPRTIRHWYYFLLCALLPLGFAAFGSAQAAASRWLIVFSRWLSGVETTGTTNNPLLHLRPRAIRHRYCFLLCALLAFDMAAQEHVSLDVMTYNIRVAYGDPGPNKWDNRKDAVADLISYYAPDILGVQEALKKQLGDITARTTGYMYTGVGRDDGAIQGEYCAILYKASKFDLLRSGTFWLSETPQTPSKGWDANFFRICTYALIADRGSGNQFWVFNTHWDHQSALARKMSARLIVDSIKAATAAVDVPVILMGDLNAEIDSEPLQIIASCLLDTKPLSATDPYGPEGTFTGFDAMQIATRRIDFVFVQEGTRVTRYRVIDDRMGMAYPSDHFPVLVTIGLPRGG